MKILRSSERSRRKGPDGWFTGEAWIDAVVDGVAPSRMQALYVEFAPGARTAWHTHPVGQTLEVTSGLGWVQLEGHPALAIALGDVVVIGPGENHWHGAQAEHGMVHLAINEWDADGKNVTWGEQVMEAEYAAAGKS
jgi:quercetin dioxygenase-like cupin family protein